MKIFELTTTTHDPESRLYEYCDKRRGKTMEMLDIDCVLLFLFSGPVHTIPDSLCTGLLLIPVRLCVHAAPKQSDTFDTLFRSNLTLLWREYENQSGKVWKRTDLLWTEKGFRIGLRSEYGTRRIRYRVSGTSVKKFSPQNGGFIRIFSLAPDSFLEEFCAVRKVNGQRCD